LLHCKKPTVDSSPLGILPMEGIINYFYRKRQNGDPYSYKNK